LSSFDHNDLLNFDHSLTVLVYNLVLHRNNATIRLRCLFFLGDFELKVDGVSKLHRANIFNRLL